MRTAATSFAARPPRCRARWLCAALVLAALCAAPARAAAPPPAIAVAFSSRSIWGPLEWALGSQRRMLQVATVGMCLALYILMWRK